MFGAKCYKTICVLCHRVRPVPSDPLDLLDLVEPRYGYLKPPVHMDQILKVFFDQYEKTW